MFIRVRLHSNRGDELGKTLPLKATFRENLPDLQGKSPNCDMLILMKLNIKIERLIFMLRGWIYSSRSGVVKLFSYIARKLTELEENVT